MASQGDLEKLRGSGVNTITFYLEKYERHTLESLILVAFKNIYFGGETESHYVVLVSMGSLCKPGYPQTLRDYPLASASRVP